MNVLVPLTVAVPLLTAAALVATSHRLPRKLRDGIAITAAAAMTSCSLVVLFTVRSHDVVYWFGGWHPDHGVALGIAFAVDPFGAGMAALSSSLVLLALVYSWTYMEDESHTYDVLILTFGAAMAGFSLTGDLFNMFVWFELMGVSAYALAGFKVRELGPLQGAVNFAITNTIGAYMILLGIALLYARTGALNLAQIGHELAGGHADRLVIVAFVLLLVGLMVKAAIVPFHFWLADAHAASPAPVCALFSGAMVELGLFFIARVYWTVFSGSFAGRAHTIEIVLVTLGVSTALVGAFMCFLQRHLKRLLAYSTISHAGIMLTGIALFDARSLNGVANLVLAHGFLKAALFLVCGIVLVELRHIDELPLRGAGRGRPLLATLWFAGTLGLIGIPYVGTFLGHQLLDEGAKTHGYAWLSAVAAVAAGVCAGAMLRAGARVFFGWGPGEDSLLTHEPDEGPIKRTAWVPLLVAVTSVAIVLGLVAAIVPGLEQRAQVGAERFVDRGAYSARVLHGVAERSAHPQPYTVVHPDTSAALYGLVALAIALATAAFGLWHARLPGIVRTQGARLVRPPVDLVRSLHTGVVGDYLLWLAAGALAIGIVIGSFPMSF